MRLFPLFIVLGLGLGNVSYSKQLIIEFYDQQLTFEYSGDIAKKRFAANEKDFKRYYQSIVNQDYHSLLRALMFYRQKYRLNDFLFYSLVDKVCLKVDARNVSYLKWFFLGKTGYKTRLTFSGNDVLIWLESDEIVTGIPKSGRQYCINCGKLSLKTHAYTRFNPFQDNETMFSFFFDPLPAFDEKSYTVKTFNLKLSDSSIKKVEVRFGNALIRSLRDRGNFNLYQTFSVQPSEGLKILFNEISEAVSRYDDSLRVEYITNFVKNSSAYSSDQDSFGKEKWMTPEEFLYYGSGDCEDRSSFTYQALKEILDRPLVIINYPKAQHVNIGISLNLRTQPNFYHKGRPYYVVEPSVVFGSLPLGHDDLVKRTKYEIIGEYIPESDLERSKSQ